MHIIIVKCDDDLDIKFNGEKIASVSSHDLKAAHPNPKGPERWTDLSLYRSEGGKFICEQIGRTRRPGEVDRHSSAIHETEEGVIGFFGTGWLAKKLYKAAGIEAVQTVD